MTLSRKTRKTGSGAKKELSLNDCDILDCLLTEILIRLPLKSIFLFKTVSKRWLSLISDPFFARSYVTRINNDSSLSRTHQQWLLLFPRFVKNIPRIQYPAAALNPAGLPNVSCSALSLSFLAPSTEDSSLYILIIASSNGLLLCCRKFPTYLVCNPLTKQYVMLPKPPSLYIGMDAGIICREDGSFTVVRAWEPESSSKMLELEIFSSETGTWRELNFSFPVPNKSYLCWHSYISYNGILYWTTVKSEKIFAYDPYRSTNQCYTVDLPERADTSQTCHLEICCGRLCCLEAGNYSLTLWELANYESGKWQLKHTSRCSDMRSNDAGLNEILPSNQQVTFRPLTVHPFDFSTVYVSCKEVGLISYNFRTRMLEIIGSGFYHSYPRAFVVPLWPTLIPQPSWDSTNDTYLF